jgi:3-phenylpropionate/cinnamic acid dioxygenase small subunit
LNTVTANTGIAHPQASDTKTGNRLATGSAIYNEVLGFLYDEAALLDQQCFDDWANLLAEDLSYTAPLRVTRAGADRGNTIIRTAFHFDDDYGSMMYRLQRLGTKSAWAEDPPSRTRRFVTNVRLWDTPKPDELEVDSYLLLSRSRYEQSTLMMMSCVRHDLLRRVTPSASKPGSFKLARREIILDQSVLGMANLAVFL